jgi:PKD repeat protein
MSYSFNKDYSSLSGIPVPLDIYDRNFNLIISNTSTLSTLTGDNIYSGKLGGIYAVPNFLTADSTISDTDFFIDFGDGTIIENNLSAFHEYKTSGNFPLTLVVTSSAGFLFRSRDNYMINVKDPVPDKIFISQDSDQQNESEGTARFFITRFNTLNTSRVLSANNYKINLSVRGNNSPLELEDNYINNANFQYQNKSFFFTSPDSNFKVIDGVETTSDFIYGKLESGQLQVSTTSAADTFLLGTSGFGTFHYFEPTVNN